MKRLTALWENYLQGGSRHFSTPTDLKLNRVLNLLLAMSYLLNFYLVVIELIFAAILLLRDFEKYKSYILPFALANIIYFLFVSFAIWLKNTRGKLGVLYPATIGHTTYLVLLSAYLGEAVGIHLILFCLVPVMFLIYDYGRNRQVFTHVGISTSGIVVALLLYEFTQPLYPIPPELAKLGRYLTWCAAISFTLIGSMYSWKQVGLTERLLATKQRQAEELLGETIPKLETAEAKYRHLVDDTADLVFQMNEAGEILSMNRACKSLVRYTPEEMIGKSLFTFVSDGLEGDPELNRTIAREYLASLSGETQLVTFRTTLARKTSGESIDVDVRLQRVPLATGTEILGKIWQVYDDIARTFLEKERGRYAIINNITHAEILSQRICDRLQRYLPAPEVNSIRVCFREILINAIEHGNLAIKFEEKTAAMASGDYMAFLRNRMRDPELKNRKVYVDFMVDDEKIAFRVTDEGSGFDLEEHLSRLENPNAVQHLEHGRGIAMTRHVFDKVVYNRKGNQVVLVKKIRA